MGRSRFLPGAVLLALLLFLLGSFILISPTPLLQAREQNISNRIGYVNIGLVFEQHPEKFRAEQLLGEEARRLQAVLEEQVEELEPEEQQALLEEYQQQLIHKERELVRAVIDEIEKTVGSIAREQEVEVVLERQNVIYGGRDLTPAVLEKIREGDNLD